MSRKIFIFDIQPESRRGSKKEEQWHEEEEEGGRLVPLFVIFALFEHSSVLSLRHFLLLLKFGFVKVVTWICQNLTHVFLLIVTWINQNWYMDFSKLLNEFVEIATCIC